MRKQYFYTFTILGLFGFGHGAWAAVDLIATPGQTATALQIQRVLSHPHVMSSEQVFSTDEAQALALLGDSNLSLTRKIRVLDERAFQELKSWIAGERLAIELTPSQIPLRIEGFESEQWGLRNDGHTQMSPIDDITSVELPGKANEDIGLERATPETLAQKPVLVAVLDTGIDYNHPDLKLKTVRKENECKALDEYKTCLRAEPKISCDRKRSHYDSDGNGYPLDCAGWNLTVGRNPLTGIQGNSNAADEIGHGTHVAGVIAANVNTLGLRGVSLNAKILPVKVLTSSPRGPVRPQSEEPLPEPNETGKNWETGFVDVIARGLLYAIRSGAQVANFSLAWPAAADSELMRGMVRLAQKHGVLIVAAAGNDATEAPVLPCNYDGVLCVAAHSPDGSLTRFSNHGSGVDLAAPGINILSTWPMNLKPIRFTEFLGYDYKNGTSMAAPFASGVLARLLAEGNSSESAYAKTLIGSRNRSQSPQATRFGNLDLAGSLQVSPQSLILPDSKQLIRISWDRQSKQLPFTITLKNFWRRASNIRVSLKLKDRASEFANLSQTQWSFKNWDAFQSEQISAALLIADPLTTRIPSNLVFELQVQADDQDAREYKLNGEIVVMIDQKMSASGFLIEGGTIAANAQIRTVLGADPNELAPPREFVAVIKNEKQWSLELLTQAAEGQNYEIRSRLTLPAPRGDLLSLYRLDWNRDDQNEYVLVFTVPHPQGKKNVAFQFAYLDHSFQLARKLDYPSDTAIIPENFQWLETKEGLTPAWITAGFTPPLEKDTKYDPWNPKPSDSPGLKFYYLAQEGLHSIKAPKDYMFVSLLPGFASLRVLLAKGSSYELSYATANVTYSDSQLLVESVQSLRLPNYRMLISNDGSAPVISLDWNGPLVIGAAFSGSSIKTSLRTTYILPNQQILDRVQRPISSADTVLRLAGAFASRERAATFVQTQYDLQFHDLISNEATSVSLRRFSFLPQLAFLRSFVPAIVADTLSGNRVPGMLVFGDLSGSETTEVLVPIYDRTRLVGLESPARLKLEAGPGCKRIGNPAEPNAQAPTQILFFCGNKILHIPQEY